MRVLMKNPNFMILDEPTNDLDIDTLNVLEDFLLKFPGVLMLVSHDRYLIDRLTDQLFIFEGEGNITIYSGNYTDYRLEQEEAKTKTKNPIKPAQLTSESDQNSKKLSYKEEVELSVIEKEIVDEEHKIKELTQELNKEQLDHNQLSKISKEIENINKTIERKTSRWMQLLELKETV